MIYATPQQIEFIVINIDDEKETARLNLRVDEILPPLLKEEQEATKEYVLYTMFIQPIACLRQWSAPESGII
jgi:hypothetical protein